MLERLFISKVRLKVLKHMLTNWEKEFHIRAIVRATNEEINAVRRELKNLESFGIFKSERRANRVFYWTNSKNPFFHELRSMMLKDSEELKLIAKVLGKIKRVELVVITQAYIDKKYESENDIDILIIGNPDVNKITKEMNEVEKELKREFRMAILSKEDYDFRKKRREKFILDVSEKEKIILLGSPNKIGL